LWGAVVGVVVLGVTFTVSEAAFGGDGYDVGFAMGVGIVLGVTVGAFVGCLAFFARYWWQ
jgi:hypothetical protein